MTEKRASCVGCGWKDPTGWMCLLTTIGIDHCADRDHYATVDEAQKIYDEFKERCRAVEETAVDQ